MDGDVEKDLWEMKIKIWRPKAVDGVEWVPVMKAIKVLRGP
jgi:hypothetical protein